MNIEQQAKELVDKFYNTQIKILNKQGITQIDEIEFEIAKQCAIICCDEIINLDYSSVECREHWQQVKEYIQTKL